MMIAIGVLLSLGLLASIAEFLLYPGWLSLMACCTQLIALAILVYAVA